MPLDAYGVDIATRLWALATVEYFFLFPSVLLLLSSLVIKAI